MIDGFSAKFAGKYGLRNALVLTEICLAAEESEKGVNSLYLQKRFPYLSRDQVYRALASLVKEKAVSCKKQEGVFSRELSYTPGESAVKQVLKELKESKAYNKTGGR
jgi:hypothetical protein